MKPEIIVDMSRIVDDKMTLSPEVEAQLNEFAGPGDEERVFFVHLTTLDGDPLNGSMIRASSAREAVLSFIKILSRYSVLPVDFLVKISVELTKGYAFNRARNLSFHE